MRKKIIAGVLVVVVAGGGAWYYQSRSAATAAAQNQTRYVFAKVQRGDIRSTISGTGPVASVNGVTVKSDQTGTVTQILAQEGQRVKAGQVVMVLENNTLVSNLRQSEVEVANNRNNLANLLSPQSTAVQAQRLKVETARLTMMARQEDVQNLTVLSPQGGVVASVAVKEGSDVAANALLFTLFDDADLTFVANLSQESTMLLEPGAKVQIDLPGFGPLTGVVTQSAGSATPTSGNRDASVPVTVSLPPTPGVRPGMVGQLTARMTGLTYVIQGSGSVKNQVTDVRAKVAGTVGQLAVAEGDRVATGDLLARLTSDTLELQLAQAENDLQTQEQNLVNLIDPAQDPSGQLRTLQQKLEQSEITLSLRQADVEDLQVKAPVEGQISQLTPRVGDRVTSNQNLFRVADYGALQITISVDELDVAKVKLGQAASLTVDALPGRQFRGKVSKINPEGIFKNDIATFEVTVAVDNPQGLMAGMNTTVNIEVENRPGVLWLPAQSVRVQQGKAFVQVLKDGQPQNQQVEIGIRTSQQVEIISGLAEGDEVIQTTVRANTSGFGPFGGGMGGGQQPAVRVQQPAQPSGGGRQ
ncbi:MAG TPA: efflux RND transporter periplasmic adaptor subunit [Symbiobacteriaceae bacterium]|nr:efflux RND transporter periplasmic adaptor subunit [Symbiobacteriaceae bacterium]